MSIPTWIIAIATVAIFLLSWANFRLTKVIKDASTKHDQEVRDLFQAMVISNVAGAMVDYNEAKKFFLEHYKGQTKIF